MTFLTKYLAHFQNIFEAFVPKLKTLTLQKYLRGISLQDSIIHSLPI